MKPKRDQHFLTDAAAVNRIADVVDVSGRKVLEIGPGKGVLTKALLKRGAIVSAVELDYQLVDYLNQFFKTEIDSHRLDITAGDATKVTLPEFEIVVANLPYSASSKITFRLLDAGFECAVLMYQKEFADRMTADIGSRGCGRLSVMVQTFARVTHCFNLSPASFTPRPQVKSSVLMIEPRYPLFPVNDRKVYSDVVRVLFSKRRKTVRSILKSSTQIFGSEKVKTLIETLDEEILKSRPEELYLEDFSVISNLL